MQTESAGANRLFQPTPKGAAMHVITRLLRSRAGTVPIEYGLIAALVSVALLVGVGSFADGFERTYARLSEIISGE